jgi:transcriptional regulator with XRE-family HTH domain
LARKQSGLTMQQLGDAMGVSRGRINQLEQLSARPELGTLHRFARAIEAELLIRSVGEELELALIPHDRQKEPLVVKV